MTRQTWRRPGTAARPQESFPHPIRKPENSGTPAAGQAPRQPLAAIVVSPECQLRNASSAATVADYGEALIAGDVFPAITVFFDGERNWLADGFHRLEAHHAAGLTDIAVDVRNGSQRDATLFAAGANASHGLRRTQADKAKAIAVLLADPEWRQWSDKELARRCGISDKTVAKARRELSGVGAADPRSGVNAEFRVEGRTFTSRHGTEATRQVVSRPQARSDMTERLLRGIPDGPLLAEVRRRGLIEGA